MPLKPIYRPTLVLDEKRCRTNIRHMTEKIKRAGCEFRPHFKTHQSITIGRWFKEEGVSGITVSSPGMAQYFADDGWDDITIAFPFYPSQIKELQRLEKKASLRLFINNSEDLSLLQTHLMKPFDFMIEVDAGYGRSGIRKASTETIRNLLAEADKFSKTNFKGFYIHDGRTYQSGSEEEIIRSVTPSINALKELKNLYPYCITSLGDTPSASVLNNFDSIDELTPGNFVFYDWMQVQAGSCTLNKVALFACLPVAQLHESRNQSILHGGAVHLSKDFIVTNGKNNYGQLIKYPASENIQHIENCFLTSLSQEHGILTGDLSSYDIGDGLAWICPIHSCLAANLFDSYMTTNGNRIPKRVLS
ncbi:MAG: alanine racemase [Balneolaceae bacterium]